MKRKITIKKLIGQPSSVACLYVFSIDDEVPEYFKFGDKYESNVALSWDYDVIETRLDTIQRDGADNEHFREEGGGVKALPSKIETSELRLYCYRINFFSVIIGNGGIKKRNKVKNKNKLINFPELNRYADTLRIIGLEIERRMKKGIDLNDIETFEIDIPDGAN